MPKKLPLIVIDAGHGGQDPGTIGRSQTKEKNITLAYAHALRDALVATGRFRANLTRSGDTFILLRERFHIARQQKADLFISLHADSAPTTRAKGLSIYTLSEDASDAEAAALATQENKVDVLADVNLGSQDDEVASILIDLAQRETKNKSIILADNIVTALRGRVELLPNTHRYAGFAVLKAPDIPSALIEIGFLSNADEEQKILSRTHRGEVVRGIITGITKYSAGQ
jgi:N-acetylmuramoyl-L-alanine amidase